ARGARENALRPCLDCGRRDRPRSGAATAPNQRRLPHAAFHTRDGNHHSPHSVAAGLVGRAQQPDPPAHRNHSDRRADPGPEGPRPLLMSLTKLNLINAFTVYLTIAFVAGTALRVRNYNSIVWLIISFPQRWPRLLALVKQYRGIFLR